MRIAKHLLIAFSILIAYSCIDEKIPTLNIKKDGAIGWKEKEECNIIYSDSQNIDELKAKRFHDVEYVVYGLRIEHYVCYCETCFHTRLACFLL